MADNRSFLRRFLTGVWRTVALLYSLALLVILVVVPVGIYLAFFHQSHIAVPAGSALVWDPVGNLVEQQSGVDSLLGSVVATQQQSSVVRDLIESLDRAAGDSRIKDVFMKLDDLGGATPGQLQDLVKAIDRFKKSGKPVVAWSSSYNQSQYELASHADTVYLDPLGWVFLTGYGAFQNYYKDALDKIGVTINVFRVGKYKSFVEPYTRNDMSPAARQADIAWMNSLWGTYGTVVAQGRPKIDAPAIATYIDGFADAMQSQGGNAALIAKNAGLVDKVAPLETVRDDMRKIVGTDQDSGSFRQINDADYLAATGGIDKSSANGRKHIAVVTVEGDIIDGESTPGSAGGDTIARLISQARRDDDVSAMILRVNSPGGSVTGAETIRRQVQAMRAAGKPVVVSMAGLAASGGYWISMNANQIWAEPSTITGSIGIFAIVPTFEKPLNKLGIHTDGVGTTPLSGALQLDRPLSDPVKMILQAGVNHGYQEFTTRVAKARHLNVQRVDEIAQGRVWSGVDAHNLGLVDKLGDFSQAEKAVAGLAHLKAGSYSLEDMQPPSDWRGAIENFLSSRVSAGILPAWLSELGSDSALDFLRHGLNDPQSLYARCFCELAQPAGPGIDGAKTADREAHF